MQKMHSRLTIVYETNAISVLVTVLMTLIGLYSPWMFQRWMPTGDPSLVSVFALTFAALIGLVASVFFHEYYRHIMVKLLGFSSELKWKPRYQIEVTEYMTKWQAMGVIAAPFTDISLIALLIMAFASSWLVIVGAITLLTVNLFLSAKDLILAAKLLIHLRKNEAVTYNTFGFHIWCVEADELRH